MLNSTKERMKSITYALFFCLAITLHNIEEAIWLPDWSQSSYSLQQPVSANEFHFAVIIITAFAYLTAFLFVQFPHNTIAKFAFIGFLGSMIFNTFVPHLLSTIIMKAYAPGLLTGLLLIVPIYTLILYRLHKTSFIKIKSILFSTIIVGSLLLILIPILFKLANILVIY